MMKTNKTAVHCEALRRAFSLIEIMVAVTLLAVITIGLLSMFYQTQKAFRLGAGQVDSLEGGRAIIDLLKRELHEMHPTMAGYTTANFEAIVSVVVNGSRTSLMMAESRTNWLQDVSFLTRRNDEWTGVSYRVDHGNRGVGTLYRFVFTTNLSQITDANGTPRIGVHPTGYANAVSNLFMLVSKPALSPISKDDRSFEQLADGIVHFRVNAYTANGTLYDWGIYDLTTPTLRFGDFDGYRFSNSVPAYLDLEIGVLDPKGRDRANAKLTAAAARDSLTNQAHRVHLFKQRIPIRARRSDFELFVWQ